MNLKDIRKQRKMTREQLAVAADVTVGTIANLETGKHEPRIGLARKIAEALDVPLDAIEWGKPKE